MSTSVVFPPIGGTTYSVPADSEVNWASLSNYLIALASAQGTTSQKVAIRKCLTTPITVISSSDCVLNVQLTTPGAVSVVLPVSPQGQYFTVVDGTGDAATNNITVTASGGATINGSASYLITTNRASADFIYILAANNWIVRATGIVGTLPIASGGTGQVTANAALNAFLPTQSGANGKVLSSDGTNSAWSLITTVIGTLPIANGGTGQITANAALNAFLPSQTSNGGKVLTTDGTNSSWAAALTSVLPSAQIFVGNGSNLAVAVAVSSEASLSNTGAMTLLNSAVIGKVLTGYVSGSGTVAATDTILQAVNKLNGNDALKSPIASPTFTGVVTIPTPFTLGAISVTATGTELNYVAGVTSAIQTQMNLKAPLASPTFTGTVTAAALTATGVCTLGTAGVANRINGPLGIDRAAGTNIKLDIEKNSTTTTFTDTDITLRLANNQSSTANQYTGIAFGNWQWTGAIYTIQEATAATRMMKFYHSDASGGTVGTVNGAGAWTFGAATGSALTTHTFQSGASAGAHTDVVALTNTTDNRAGFFAGQSGKAVGITYDRNNDRRYVWSNSTLEFIYTSTTTLSSPISSTAGFVAGGSMSSAGAWTLGPASGLTSAHLMQNSSTAGGDYVCVFKKLAVAGDDSSVYYAAFSTASTNQGYIWNNASGNLELFTSSDLTLKDNIRDADYGLTQIMGLRPVTFDWKSGAAQDVRGFIAQEVQQVLPRCVNQGPDGTLQLGKDEFIPIMVKAIQELSAKNDALEARLAVLEGV